MQERQRKEHLSRVTPSSLTNVVYCSAQIFQIYLNYMHYSCSCSDHLCPMHIIENGVWRLEKSMDLGLKRQHENADCLFSFCIITKYYRSPCLAIFKSFTSIVCHNVLNLFSWYLSSSTSLSLTPLCSVSFESFQHDTLYSSCLKPRSGAAVTTRRVFVWPWPPLHPCTQMTGAPSSRMLSLMAFMMPHLRRRSTSSCHGCLLKSGFSSGNRKG